MHLSLKVEIQPTVPDQGQDMLAEPCPVVEKGNGPVQLRLGSPNVPLALPVDNI